MVNTCLASFGTASGKREVKLCLISQQTHEIRTGVGTYTHSLVPALVQKGHEVTLIGCGPQAPWPEVPYHALSPFPWDPVPERWLSFSWKAARLVQKLASSFDLIHFLDAREALFLGRTPCPVLGTVHDCYFAQAPLSPFTWSKTYSDWPLRYPYFHIARRLEKKSLQKLGRVLANSRYVQRALAQAYSLPAAKIRVVPYGLSFPWPRVNPGENKPPYPQILFVGGNFQRKGLPTLLRALVQVKKRLPEVRLHVVGDHPTRRRMMRLAEKLGLFGQVVFFGAIPHRALAPFYRSAWVFALPSLVEGWGLVLLEAMYFGIPVIGSTEGGSGELVQEGWDGYLVRPGDPQALAEKLELLLTQRELRVKMGERGQKRALEFTPERMVEGTLEAYREALGCL